MNEYIRIVDLITIIRESTNTPYGKDSVLDVRELLIKLYELQAKQF